MTQAPGTLDLRAPLQANCDLLAGERDRLSTLVAENERIAADLRRLRRDLEGRFADRISALSSAVTDAVGFSFPAIADDGFGIEIAYAARRIGRKCPGDGLTVRVGPERAAVVERLLEDVAGLKILADPALQSGEAEFEWDDGGARLEADRLVGAAMEILSRRIEELETKENPDV